MTPQTIKKHYKLLSHLLRSLVAERFKRMAKDESLFKFISSRIEPAVLVDHELQSEKEALDLAEMSLLELVSAERLEAELFKSASKLQANFQKVFGPDVSKSFSSEGLIEKRMIWLGSRVGFYRSMLSISDSVDSPLELGARAFRNLKRFNEALSPILQSDRALADEVVQSTNSMFRFLMKKHFDYELENFETLWNEFKKEAFRKIPELTE